MTGITSTSLSQERDRPTVKAPGELRRITRLTLSRWSPEPPDLSPVGAGGRGRDGFAAPVTLPSAPAVPSMLPLLVPYADDPIRLLSVRPTAQFQPPPKEQPDHLDANVSRVVVGYLRVPSELEAPGDAATPLVATIAQYARDRGLTLLRVHQDDVTDDDARRPGFSACLRHLYLREACAIVVPTWDHLAPNEVLRRALCLNATSAGGTIQVVNP